MKPYFPMFIPLEGRRVLIAGGGTVALRKLERLAPFGAFMRVIAPSILPELLRLPRVEPITRAFAPSDLDGDWAFVIAATDDAAENRAIAEACHLRGIPVNVVDDPACCSFLFPALVQRGPFCAGISTGGASPTAAVHFKEQLEATLPENLEEILTWLHAQRPALRAVIPQERARAAVLRRLFAACMEKGAPLDDAEMEAWL